MSEETRLLFANDAFYTAFAARDMAQMVEVWSAEDPLYCLHPGWPLLVGRATVIESWAGILGAEGPAITVEAPLARIEGTVGIVLCSERLGRGVLAATNLFRKEGGRWRLFHHQAGPTQSRQAEATREPERRLQ